MARRISSIQAHVNAVERHVNAVKHLQETQFVLRQARLRLQHQQGLLARNLSSREYAEMLEELPVPAYLLDRERPSIIAANSQFATLLGYSAEEAMGLPFMKVMADDLVPTFERALRRDPPEDPVKWRLKKSDGKQVSLVIKCRRISLLCCGRKLTNVSYGTILRWHGSTEFDATEYFAG